MELMIFSLLIVNLIWEVGPAALRLAVESQRDSTHQY